MIAKVLYFNWHKARIDDAKSLAKRAETQSPCLMVRVTMGGEFLSDRPDLYDYVYTYVYADLVTDVEDVLFERLNMEDRRKFIPAKHMIRSMSVGDVVLIGQKAIVCQGMGWKTLDSVPEAFHKLSEVDEQR